MGTFVQLVVDGLSTGSIYGAIALAIVLVNQATGLINFAQGGMAVLAAYVGVVADDRTSVPLIVAHPAVGGLRPSCSVPWSSGGSCGGSSAATPTPRSSSRSAC